MTHPPCAMVGLGLSPPKDGVKRIMLTYKFRINGVGIWDHMYMYMFYLLSPYAMRCYSEAVMSESPFGPVAVSLLLEYSILLLNLGNNRTKVPV